MFVSASLLLILSARFIGVLAQNATSNSSCVTSPTVVDMAAAWGTAGALWPIDEFGTHRENTSAYYTWMYSVQPSGAYNITLNVPAGSSVPEDSDPWNICYVGFDFGRNTLERAQTDSGNCRTALDDECVDSILDAARAGAHGNTSELACVSVQSAVGDALTSGACLKYFNGKDYNSGIAPEGPTVASSQLTGLQDYLHRNGRTPCRQVSDKLAPGATLLDAGLLEYSLNPAKHPLAGLLNGSDAVYQTMFRTVRPLVTIYLRNTNVSKPTTGNDSGQFLDMQCLRPTDWNNSYGEAAQLPSPTPVSAASLITPQGSVLASFVTMALLASFTFGASALW